jgi:cation diffusion facilitator family transporter
MRHLEGAKSEKLTKVAECHMHTRSIEDYQHSHVFLGKAHERNERKTWVVIAVCAAMMVAEIVGGLWFGSVALIADGLHMSTHAGALLIAALAYTYSRQYANDARLTFGTGKFGDLAAFTSAIALAMIALLIGYESVDRFLNPIPISFSQAIPIAVVGLGVNLLSAFLLRDDHHHERRHHYDGHAHNNHRDLHDHTHVHTDHNLRAAFVHVMADAAVSVLVIIGLLAGRQLGWVWMDPLMGLVATFVILSWSWTLIRSAGAVLLDVCPDPALSRAITTSIEQGSDRVSDLHLWRLGPGHLAAVITVVTHNPRSPDAYKGQLSNIRGLSHVTIEVQTCPGEHH